MLNVKAIMLYCKSIKGVSLLFTKDERLSFVNKHFSLGKRTDLGFNGGHFVFLHGYME